MPLTTCALLQKEQGRDLLVKAAKTFSQYRSLLVLFCHLVMGDEAKELNQANFIYFCFKVKKTMVPYRLMVMVGLGVPSGCTLSSRAEYKRENR